MAVEQNEIKDLATAISVLEFLGVEFKEVLAGERESFSSQLQEYREVFTLLMSLRKEIKTEIQEIGENNKGRFIPSENFEDLKIVLEAVRGELSKPVHSKINEEIRSLKEDTLALVDSSEKIRKEIMMLKKILEDKQGINIPAPVGNTATGLKQRILKYAIPFLFFASGSVSMLLFLVFFPR